VRYALTNTCVKWALFKDTHHDNKIIQPIIFDSLSSCICFHSKQRSEGMRGKQQCCSELELQAK